MIKLCVALLLCALTPALAQVGCRSPTQMTARLLTLEPEENRVIRERFYYDATNIRFAAFEEIQQGDTFDAFEFIVDYNTRLRYVITRIPNNPLKCTVTRLPLGAAFRIIGVPDNATLAGGYTLGMTLNVNYYTDEFWQGGWAGSFTTTGCLPIAIQMQTARHGYTMQDFYDIVIGITDPSVFIPPSACNGQPILDATEEVQRRGTAPASMPEALGPLSRQLQQVDAEIATTKTAIANAKTQTEKELLMTDKVQLQRKAEQIRAERLIVLSKA